MTDPDKIFPLRDTARAFFNHGHPASLGPGKAALLLALRIAHGVFVDLREGQLTLRAMSLVYTTLFAMVPLLAISFSVLKGLGAHNEVLPFLLRALSPLGDKAPEIAATIVGFVDNMQLRVLGFIGVALLFYTVISLIKKIEGAFNYIWQISRQRTLAQRFRDYLSVVIVGPVLVFASLGIMAGLMRSDTASAIIAVPPFGWLFAVVGWLAPTVMVILAFAFIYLFVPNTRVAVRSALLGGIVAGILWNGIGWAFATYVATLPGYVEIYSSFASPLIFLIWLYLSWLILLVGTSITFYHQHAENFPVYRGLVQMSGRVRDKLALAVVRAIGERYYGDQAAPTPAELADRLALPVHIVETTLNWLSDGGIVALSADNPPTCVPARPWEAVSVDAVLRGLRGGPGDQLADLDGTDIGTAMDAVVARLDRSIAEAFGDTSLKALATMSLSAPLSGPDPRE
ncbi:MAG: YihY/virulence factor BrkB family protein [Alphaproteobacteria bacterium]|nr:YihY/virulence factor BrkB family protein [Alphaproteobacteria bacterium]